MTGGTWGRRAEQNPVASSRKPFLTARGYQVLHQPLQPQQANLYTCLELPKGWTHRKARSRNGQGNRDSTLLNSHYLRKQPPPRSPDLRSPSTSPVTRTAYSRIHWPYLRPFTLLGSQQYNLSHCMCLLGTSALASPLKSCSPTPPAHPTLPSPKGLLVTLGLSPVSSRVKVTKLSIFKSSKEMHQ